MRWRWIGLVPGLVFGCARVDYPAGCDLDESLCAERDSAVDASVGDTSEDATGETDNSDTGAADTSTEADTEPDAFTEDTMADSPIDSDGALVDGAPDAETDSAVFDSGSEVAPDSTDDTAPCGEGLERCKDLTRQTCISGIWTDTDSCGVSCGPHYCVDAVQIAAGGASTCAVIFGGTMSGARCWGANNYGEVGNGTVTDREVTPVEVTKAPGYPLDSVSSIAVGNAHACAIAGGKVYCWGYNGQAQIGNGSTGSFVSSPYLTTVANADALVIGNDTIVRTSTRTLVGWGGNSNCDVTGDDNCVERASPFAVPGITGVAQFGHGAGHTCILSTTGALECWGMNFRGEVGDGTRNNATTPKPITLTGISRLLVQNQSSCAIMSDTTVKCWGRDPITNGDILSPTTIPSLKGIIDLAIGDQVVCAVAGDKTVTCWDWTGSHYPKTPTAVPELTNVTQIVAGTFHMCALSQGKIYCWGANDSGQLGDGTTTERWTPKLVRW